jgi:hypothetical protein
MGVKTAEFLYDKPHLGSVCTAFTGSSVVLFYVLDGRDASGLPSGWLRGGVKARAGARGRRACRGSGAAPASVTTHAREFAIPHHSPLWQNFCNAKPTTRRGSSNMGRRPNQLILEFFERGPKLEDASNRYQHTCKSCGEKVSSNNRCSPPHFRFPPRSVTDALDSSPRAV